MVEFRFVDKYEGAALLCIHWKTLAQYRKDKNIGWIEGVHYSKLPSGEYRYNDLLLKDWLANQHDPIAHQRAIELYRASLPSNQTTRRKSNA